MVENFAYTVLNAPLPKTSSYCNITIHIQNFSSQESIRTLKQHVSAYRGLMVKGTVVTNKRDVAVNK